MRPRRWRVRRLEFGADSFKLSGMKLSRKIHSSLRSSLALIVATFIFSSKSYAQTDAIDPTAGLPLEETASRGIVTRDPSDIVKCGDEYWVFYTGRGVPSYHSKDLVKWERGPAVFKTAPEWIAGTAPKNRNMNYWAPDIMKLGDRYLLYYAVSSMGSMNSGIGLATASTLDPNDPRMRLV